MTLTDEQVALILDPERKRDAWWGIRYGEWQLMRAFIPPLTTDDLAAFRWVVPVLRKMGLLIEIYEHGCYIRIDQSRDDPEAPWSSWVGVSGYSDDDDTPQPLAPACAQALAWLQENEPERLRKAVEEVYP